MERFNIEKDGIEFKNLLSGPAPVGRILNYIYAAGTSGICHKNGYRSLDFKGQIGSAWATEFIIGLGIFYLGSEMGDKYKLLLTKKGQRLFDIMQKGKYSTFDEGSNSNSILTIKQQMNNCSKDLAPALKQVFVNSYPFLILKQFLEENGYTYSSRDIFMDDLFEAVKKLYDEDPTPYNRESRTPTARNRVPSLLQMCQVFDMVDDSDGNLVFSKKIINEVTGEERPYSKEDLEKVAKECEYIIADADKLAEKYGLDGTVLIESVVRNSELQRIFKTNLMIRQHGKCVMCGLEKKELLIGSHIKPASSSNVAEKADENNGLLLCCNHDKLFDRYLISFDFLDGQIEISKSITKEEAEKLGLDPDYKLPEDLLTPERQKYLMEHKMEFLKREENR